MRDLITDAWVQADTNPTGARNHGKPWTQTTYDALKRAWFNETYSMEEICGYLGRSRLSIVSKLRQMGLVTYNQQARQYEPVVPTETQTTQENIMAANIETKTFINGVEASTLTDAQIFQRIAQIEGQIDQLKAIRVQSEKLTQAIAHLESDVNSLAAYVDGR